MQRLSDLVSHAGLALYAEVALVLFLVAFLVIVWRVIAARRSEMEELARKPLEDAGTSPSPGARP